MSCPLNQCLNGGKCSTRLNGNFYCQCVSPYSGINCQLGSSFLSFSIFEATFFLTHFIRNKIGGLDSNEQIILTNFYNGLISKGNLVWNVVNNLCGQSGVTCDSSNPKRITQLYTLFFFFLSLSLFLIIFF